MQLQPKLKLPSHNQIMLKIKEKADGNKLVETKIIQQRAKKSKMVTQT